MHKKAGRHAAKPAPRKAHRKVAPKTPIRRQAAPAAPVVESGNALGVLLSITQAAEEFGHDRRTITKRVAELGLRSAGERQGYAVYRLRDLLEMERRSPDGKHDPDKMSPFERQAHFKAESEKLKVDFERRVLMRREDAEFEWARVLKLIALELDTVVDEIERDVGASTLVLEKIEAKIDIIRQRMYDAIVAAAPADSAEGGQAPEPVEQPGLGLDQ